MTLFQEIHSLIIYSKFFLIFKYGDSFKLYGFGKRKISDKKYLDVTFLERTRTVLDGEDGFYFGGKFLGFKFISYRSRVK